MATYGNIGDLQKETGQTRDTLQSYEQGLVIFQRLAVTNPEVVRFQIDLAISHNLIGRVVPCGQPAEGG